MQCHDSEYQPFLLSPLKSAPAPLLQFQVAPNAMELLQSISVLNSTATCPEKCLAKGTGLSDSIVNKVNYKVLHYFTEKQFLIDTAEKVPIVKGTGAIIFEER